MPFRNLRCVVTGEPVAPHDCIAHAVSDAHELPNLGCHFTPETLLGIIRVLREAESFDARTWRVTELLACPREVRLKRQSAYDLDPRQAYALWRGAVFHAALNALHDPIHTVLSEKRFSAKLGSVIITGKPDLITNYAEPRLVDFKSTDAIPKDLKDGHAEQLNGYRWLLARNGIVVADEAEIVYLSMKETRRLPVRLVTPDETETWIQQRIEPLVQKGLPAGAISWKCKTCPVAVLCQEK